MGRNRCFWWGLCLLASGCPDDSKGTYTPPPVDLDLDGFDEFEDCDDSRPDVNPDAPEICGDGVDNDCIDGDAICAIDSDGSSSSAETYSENTTPSRRNPVVEALAMLFATTPISRIRPDWRFSVV